MKAHYKSAVLSVIVIAILSSCTSPREFLEMGNYHAATLKSIKKLNGRSSAKQERILAESYSKAIQSIKNNIQEIAETATINKWHLLEQEYSKINSLHDAVNSSRVRLQIDRQLLTDLQQQAAEVTFEADVSNSREYKSFLNAYRVEREKYLEILNQPKTRPELHVGYEEINDSDSSYLPFQLDIVKGLNRMRLKVDVADARNQEQVIKVSYEGCRKDSTVITQTPFGSANTSTGNVGIPNSLNNAPPEALFGKSYQPGSDFSFRYTITIKCLSTVTISDRKTNSVLYVKRLEGKDAWVSQWYKYRSNLNSSLAAMSPKAIQWRYKSGSQGLSEYDYLARTYYNELYRKSNQSLEKKMIAELCSFYDYYLREY
jgi:hypothetical protein